MKTCSKCRVRKHTTEFAVKGKYKDDSIKKQACCKECNKKYQKEHYKKNKAEYKRKAVLSNRKIRKDIGLYVWNYLLDHPCIDCGEEDPVVLEFDHVRGKKDKAISALMSNGISKEKLKKEILKCDIRCRNCHQRKTAKELGWYKYLLPSSTG